MDSEKPEPPSLPPTIPVPSPRPKLKHQWILVGIVVAACSACLTADALAFPAEFGEGQRTPLTFVAMILAALGQGMWITMDRARLGLPVGWWRFGAVLLGPIVIALHLALEYRLRALYLIPLGAVVYGAVVLIPTAILLIAAI